MLYNSTINEKMKKTISIITITVIAFIIMNAVSEGKYNIPYKVKIEYTPLQISLSELPTFSYGGKPGYYFSIKVSVTNQDTKKRKFMVDDDCTFASWKSDEKPLKILTNNCLKNVYEDVSLAPHETYSTNLKIWFPENYTENKISFRIGFIEIIDNEIASGPYWSDEVNILIEH